MSPGQVIFLTFATCIAVVLLFMRHRYRRNLWDDKARPLEEPLIYVDARMGVRPTILSNQVPEGYRLACLWLGTGVVDRTGKLDHGFRPRILDPIPAPQTVPDFATLCDDRARDIVAKAQRSDRPIKLFWSGGLDSTLAACALIKVLDHDTKRLTIFKNAASDAEYPWFASTFLKQRGISTKTISSVPQALKKAGPESHIVTGELGDQLFGSAKALDIAVKTLKEPWPDALNDRFKRDLASHERAKLLFNYLSPQIAAAPVPIDTLYECLWWLNYSLKWQYVSLRMLTGFPGHDALELRSRTHHFFQTIDFEKWALTNPDKRIRGSWATHKWPMRDYIAAETGDTSYTATKTKEPSLKGMLQRPFRSTAWALTAAGATFIQPVDLSLRQILTTPQGAGQTDSDTETGIEIGYDFHREDPLWDNLSDDGE